MSGIVTDYLLGAPTKMLLEDNSTDHESLPHSKDRAIIFISHSKDRMAAVFKRSHSAKLFREKLSGNFGS